MLFASHANAQLERHLPIYDAQSKILYAKVKMADGSSLPGITGVEAVCGGIAYPLGFTDSQGNFRFTIDSGKASFNPSFNAEGTSLDVSVLADCEFRAESAGLLSRRVSPRWLKEMKDASTISLGSILLSRPPGAQSDSPIDAHVPKPAKNAYKKGGSAMADSKWDNAKSEFDLAVRLHPGYVLAWIGLGLANEALKKQHEAELAYQQAVKLSPKSAGPYLRMARLEATAGNWEQADLYSETAIGLDPQNLAAGYSLCAMANLKLGRMDVAGSSARAGLRLKAATEYPDLWLSLSLAQAAGKRYADAATSLETYLRLVPRAATVPEIKDELVGLQTRLSR